MVKRQKAEDQENANKQLLANLVGEGLRPATAATLARRFDSLEQIRAAESERLEAIDQVGPRTVDILATGDSTAERGGQA